MLVLDVAEGDVADAVGVSAGWHGANAHTNTKGNASILYKHILGAREARVTVAAGVITLCGCQQTLGLEREPTCTDLGLTATASSKFSMVTLLAGGHARW